MAQDISQKYTDELFLSKSQLQSVLQTSLIDGYWNEIVSYRKKYAKRLGLHTLRRELSMGIILTEAIKAKVISLDSAIQHLLSTYKNIDHDSDRIEAEKVLMFSNLSSLSKLLGSPMSDAAIKTLLAQRYNLNEEKHAPIIDFYRTLQSYGNSNILPADDIFLGDAYARLLRVDDLTSFFRDHDFDDRAKKAMLMDKDLPYAPYEKIDSLMEELFTTLKNNDIHYLIRALLALYYVDILAPFESKNKELAILLAMDVLANGKIGNEAFLLPLTSLLISNDRREQALLTSGRTGDFTYFMLYCVDALKAEIASIQQEIDSLLINQYKKEVNVLSKTEEKLFNSSKGMTQMSIFDDPEEEKVISKEIVKENPPVKQTPVKEIEKEVLPNTQINEVPVEVSISITKKGLSDKEVKEYTKYLLESNPNLSKKQASFLASHCTMGHYYTIQQFKKAAHCAYETARTSMDKLVEQGYYLRMNLKNKHVYTPKDPNSK